MHGTSSRSKDTRLSEVLSLLDLFSLTLELPRMKRRDFFALQTNSIGIVVIYFGVCDYLVRPVLENDQFLHQVKNQLRLREFLIRTILFAHQLEQTENGKLAQFLISLVIGTKKGSPVFVQLVEINIGSDSFQKVTLTLTDEGLSGGFSSKVTHLFRLISEKVKRGRECGQSIICSIDAVWIQTKSQ